MNSVTLDCPNCGHRSPLAEAVKQAYDERHSKSTPGQQYVMIHCAACRHDFLARPYMERFETARILATVRGA